MPRVSRVRVRPAELAGRVVVPGDKSLSHRALILGALAGGPVDVAGLAASGDVRSTAAALRTLGAEVHLEQADDGGLHGRVTGPLREADDVIDCGNSGTSLRLLAGVVAGIDGLAVLTGDASLRRRPVGRVADPLRAMGAVVDGRDGGGRPPVAIRGGRLHGIEWRQPVASAQVKSCVLLAGLGADGPVSVTSPFPSRDHTERLLGHLGVHVERVVADDGTERVRLEPGGSLTPRPIEVPGDPSSAAFWLVAAAAGAGTIETTGICLNETRTGVLRVLERLGAEVSTGEVAERCHEPVGDVRVAPAPLGGTTVSGREVVDAIDELPVLALAGAASARGLTVADAGELRVKESDRITVLATALRAVGLRIEERPDGYVVPGGQRPRGGQVDAAGDHRIAMTAAIAGVLGTAPVEISGFEAVATSYPSFLEDLRRLGGRVEVLEHS